MTNRMQRLIKLTLSLVMLLALLGLGVAHPAAAQSNGGYLTFENGTDGAVISSTIPGVEFTNTAGFDWVYGDVRTGNYNAPYPNGAYAVDGNFFAWLGAQQGEGKITFTQGTGSFFSADFSTGEALNIAAYDTQGNLLTQQSLATNTNTGRLDRVTLTAPAGTGISYVLISGAANFWLLDNMATDAPGVPNQGSPKLPAVAAYVTVVQRPNPNTTAAPGAVVTYTIVAKNWGEGAARQTYIDVPFDPAEVKVLDAAFSRDSAWVSALDSENGMLELQTGLLGAYGDVVTATVRMQVLGSTPVGTDLGQRLAYSWLDEIQNGAGHSNMTMLHVGDDNIHRSLYSLDNSLSGGLAGSTHVFTSAIFAPNEPVDLWYNKPDGSVVGIGRARADDNGLLTEALTTTDFGAGTYSMVAYGTWTQFTAVADFEVTTVSATKTTTRTTMKMSRPTTHR